MAHTVILRNEILVEIEDSKGEVLQLGVGTVGSRDALSIQLKLQHIGGPAFLAAVGGSNVKDILANKDAQFALVKLFENMHMHEADLNWIFNKFDAMTRYSSDNGETWHHFQAKGENSRDELFSGRHELLYKWLFEHLKHNFAGFLGFVKSAASEKEQKQ